MAYLYNVHLHDNYNFFPLKNRRKNFIYISISNNNESLVALSVRNIPNGRKTTEGIHMPTYAGITFSRIIFSHVNDTT